jgi:predicted transcriptional regulator YheO
MVTIFTRSLDLQLNQYMVFSNQSVLSKDGTTNKNQEKLKSISVIIQNILDNMILFIVSFINIPILISRQRWL